MVYQQGSKNCFAISGITLYPTSLYPTIFVCMWHTEGFWPGSEIHFVTSVTSLYPTLPYLASTLCVFWFEIKKGTIKFQKTNGCSKYLFASRERLKSGQFFLFSSKTKHGVKFRQVTKTSYFWHLCFGYPCCRTFAVESRSEFPKRLKGTCRNWLMLQTSVKMKQNAARKSIKNSIIYSPCT